ncbi:MAG: poly-beta-hydroxybutyrate polymerase N-terminal domain-containing protein, partial [Alphaproteobacteria bacterium]|nr:poly-beta-hydroxybutyrate polymerase N-terminal domain-containing protein [Alphaproteobacteria bacterium]
LSPYFRGLDTYWQAALARLTLGLSPAGVAAAFLSWASHLAQSPGKILESALYPSLHAPGFIHRMSCARDETCAADPRFRSARWDRWPWRLYAESFLYAEDWWRQATTGISGLEDNEERIVSFAARQMMDAFCPANFPVTNPDLAAATLGSGGLNLWHGAQNAWRDFSHMAGGGLSEEEEKFKVGVNIAATPGEVVFRNGLIELIRYAPQTESVYKEPVLILPAWIMKYYILDLSSHNSLVRWLVAQGHTVYMASWKNPAAEDRNLGMDEYYRLGAMAAVDAVSGECPGAGVHLTGYCLGGTLALITAAAMAGNGDGRLRSLSLFAAQGDFTEAGELKLFVTHSEVAFLKNLMEVQGYLDTRHMAGAFQMLRSYDLIWSKAVNDYLKGLRRDAFDLTAWNADATRMPAKMHGEYLDRLFLHNDFAEGRFKVEGRPVAAEDIRIPVFAVGTEKDHIAPWRSVYKIQMMVNGDVTFALAAGGHNAGIVSEPGHPDRFYHLHERKAGDRYTDPDKWRGLARREEGSWWPAWESWLRGRSAPDRIKPPAWRARFGAAPGAYVLQK